MSYRPKDWLYGGGYQDEVNGAWVDNFSTIAYEDGGRCDVGSTYESNISRLACD